MPPDLSRLRVLLNRATGTIPLAVATDGTIRAPVLPGQYRVSVQMPGAGERAEWFAVSARFGGVDVLDAGIDVPVSSVLPELVIDLTNQVAEIAGSLTDAAGQPAPEYFVVVFPSDRALWKWGSHRIRQVRPGSDGRFVFAALPPGDYQIGAVTDVEDNQWFEPEFLEQLLPASVKVTLGSGQRLVQNLRVR